ncbi:hypothetical protein AGMMS50255_6530 [Spirochaetia bacterium]|nr:hypothetical protein AGMMS50255_6530 [Spirochaetia bacterium]
MTDYIPVLCCSNSKNSESFSCNSKIIKFVASPNAVPNGSTLYYRPDDQIPGSPTKTWRDLINEQNHKDLIPAFKLYSNRAYCNLYEKYRESFYIFSAGWGIVRSTYKLPAYNITYSKQGEPWTKRTKSMQWNDFNHLRDDANGGKFSSDAKIVLFAAPDYIYRFYELTSMIRNTKIIIHKPKEFEKKTGYEYIHYTDKIRTNWFYKAANEFSIKGLTDPNFKK